MTPSPDALTVLIESLDGFAAALESGRADAVLLAEETLASAVSGMQTADLTMISRNPDTRGRTDEARHKLSRCRAMGAAASGLVIAMGVSDYGRHGRPSMTPAVVATTPAMMASRG